MPRILRPVRSALISKFDKENERTIAVLKRHAETLSADRARDKAPEPVN
jgi:hypothetical protein